MFSIYPMINKIFSFLICFTVVSNAHSLEVDSSYIKEIKNYQQSIDSTYRSESESPLEKKDKKKFIGNSYFTIDESYKVEATLILTPQARPFEMKTSRTRTHSYRKYGVLKFEINGAELRLSVYQSESHKTSEKYKDFLFLPFKDRTNKFTTYGGGRYIDLKIPKGDKIIIDFNKAYNPYCHYNPSYSCPIVPRENNLLVEINAGMKKYEGRLEGN